MRRHGQGLRGLTEAAFPLEIGVARPLDRLVHVEIRAVQEVPHEQGMDEIRDALQLQVAGVLESLDDDLLDRPLPVHELHDLRLARLQAVVHEVAGVRDHGVVVAPLQVELLQIHPVGELGAEPRDVDHVGQPVPQPPVAVGHGLRGGLRLERPPDAGAGRSRPHVPAFSFSSAIRRCTAP